MAQENIFEIVKGDQDIVDCDQIPIRFQGEIQSFGFVVGFDVATEQILFYSNNARTWFASTQVSGFSSISLEDLFGEPLYDFLFTRVKLTPEGSRAYPVPRQLMTLVDGESVWVTRSRGGKVGYFEFERVWQSEEHEIDAQAMASHFASIEYLSDDMFFQALTDVYAKLLPSERILLYRFDDEWNGEVVAETCEEARKRFLNHWFPASDIPRQVRDQYLAYPIRMISDVSTASIGLTMLDESAPESVDLSRFVSRGVTRVHQEYLLNMDVHSAFSVAIIADGKLWGLVAIHHSCPRVVPPPTRAMLHSLALLAGCRIGEMEANERASAILSRQEALLALQESFHEKSLDLETAKRLIQCDGILYLRDDEPMVGVGEVPSEGELKSIRAILDSHASEERGVLVFDDLSHERKAHELTFAGAMAVYQKSNHTTEYLVWLRKPRVERRLWGGNPTKMELLPGRGRIQPRKSFETWVNNYARSPLKYSPSDIQLARQCLNTLGLGTGTFAGHLVRTETRTSHQD